MLALALARPGLAQMDPNMPMPPAHHHPTASDTTHAQPGQPADSSMNMQGMDMSGMSMPAGQHDHDMHGMHGAAMYGPYPMTREASGTSWQPDLAMHRGLHVMRGSWTLMLHGFADLVYDDQGGPRGDTKTFSNNMLMGMAHRALGPGRLAFRTMVSVEPATIGKEGYPLLLQTGETADGVTPLIDRQHPHDAFMELAAAYSISRGSRSVFLYGGLPGEPALGPPAFMHRFSAMEMPQAPITHHWLDSSHITYGVLTGGLVAGGVKLEASAFRGREPDENRWNIESPKLDSHSFRLSWNPAPPWALQASYGRLHSPEQLEPDVDVDRTTASVIYAKDGSAKHWETTLAWGENNNRPGPTLDAVTLESAVQIQQRHTFMARLERVEKDELFPPGDPRDGIPYNVGEVSAGYRFDFWRRGHAAVGIGALGTMSFVPDEIRDAYGNHPTSGMIFGHIELR